MSERTPHAAGELVSIASEPDSVSSQFRRPPLLLLRSVVPVTCVEATAAGRYRVGQLGRADAVASSA